MTPAIARGQELGLARWPFSFGGRAGVLGDVDADVVAAVCGFFAPALVRESWSTARAELVELLDGVRAAVI
jgi:hypothetical protein